MPALVAAGVLDRLRVSSESFLRVHTAGTRQLREGVLRNGRGWRCSSPAREGGRLLGYARCGFNRGSL